MGNVVSSMLMYALQATWYCQRLIDQDYRQNHGSRSKPIMDFDEIDLNAFLFKCRAYYLSRKKTNPSIEYSESPQLQLEGKKKWSHQRSRSNVEAPEGRKYGLCLNYCLNFDNERFVSKMDQQVALSQEDFGRLMMDKGNLETFLSRSNDLSKGALSSNCDSPRTERRKRKKLYYRQRYNPRVVEANLAECQGSQITSDSSFVTGDVATKLSYHPDFHRKNVVSRSKHDIRETSNEPTDPVAIPPEAPQDFFLVIKNLDEDQSTANVDEVLFTADEKVLEMMMVP